MDGEALAFSPSDQPSATSERSGSDRPKTNMIVHVHDPEVLSLLLDLSKVDEVSCKDVRAVVEPEKEIVEVAAATERRSRSEVRRGK